jgi:hypothetical protein
MRKIFLLVVLLFNISNSWSQIRNGQGTSSMGDGLFMSQGDVKGSPFFLEGWTKGTVYKDDGEFKDNQELVYNLFNNTLFLKIGIGLNDHMALTTKEISKFILYDNNGTKSYLFLKIEAEKFNDNKKNIFFYEAVDPKSDKVIIEHSKTFSDPNSSGWQSSRYNNKAGEFKDLTKVYVLNKNLKYEKVNPNENAILKLFKENRKQIEEFIDSKGIKIRQASDLVAIVEYYHSL